MSFIAAEKKNFPLEIEKGILSGIQLSITQMAFGHVFFLSFSYSRAVPWSSSFMTRIFLKNVGKLFRRMWCEHFFFFLILTVHLDSAFLEEKEGEIMYLLKFLYPKSLASQLTLARHLN